LPFIARKYGVGSYAVAMKIRSFDGVPASTM